MKANMDIKRYIPVVIVLETEQEARTVITALNAFAGDVAKPDRKNEIEKMAMLIAEAARL